MYRSLQKRFWIVNLSGRSAGLYWPAQGFAFDHFYCRKHLLRSSLPGLFWLTNIIHKIKSIPSFPGFQLRGALHSSQGTEAQGCLGCLAKGLEPEVQAGSKSGNHSNCMFIWLVQRFSTLETTFRRQICRLPHRHLGFRFFRVGVTGQAEQFSRRH